MINVKSRVVPEDVPSLEDWIKEFNVGSTYSRFQKEPNKEKNYVKEIIQPRYYLKTNQ